jgi:peroxiredoxin (alkyl hydroperoxide reductase subunit C)
MRMLQVQQKAPEFKAEAVVGSGDFKTISLADFKGKFVVLFFYPEDFTFVCPTEILEFSKRADEFDREGAQILGASCDSRWSHRAWIQDGLGELRFPLLADFNKTIARDYGALLEDKGIPTRATFIIDPDGVLQYASYNNTQVGRSVGEVLRVLQGIKTGERCPADWKPGQKTLGRG